MEPEQNRTKIRSADEADFSDVRALCTERFGEGYLTKEEFDCWLCDPDFFLIAEEEGRFCGFCYLMPEDPGRLASFMKITDAEVELASGGKPVLHCRSAALVSSEEHRGVMYALLSREIENAKKRGFGAAFAPAWTYNGKIPMGKLMDALGFRKVGERDGLWLDQENYTCVVCGGKCRCRAVIYELRL